MSDPRVFADGRVFAGGCRIGVRREESAISTPLRLTFFPFGCALLVKRLGRLLPGLFLPIHALAHRIFPPSLDMRDRVHAMRSTFTRAGSAATRTQSSNAGGGRIAEYPPIRGRHAALVSCQRIIEAVGAATRVACVNR